MTGGRVPILTISCKSLSLTKLATGLFVAFVSALSLSGSLCADALPGYVQKADDYWLGRQNTDNVRSAIAVLLEGTAKNPSDYEAWWRLSRLDSFLARNTSGREKDHALSDGISAGKRAVALQPNRVEGHFWLGANQGLLAEDGGLLEGLRLVETVRKEMETVVKLNPDYEEGSGFRTLGRVYYRAPFFKGGDKRRSIQLLEDCLKKYPDNSLTMLYLADSYIGVGRRAEARELLQRILRLCPDPDYGPELADNQTQAQYLLQREFRAGK
jgi:tetratricopeptide (TPR) repeat protein